MENYKERLLNTTKAKLKYKNDIIQRRTIPINKITPLTVYTGY